MAEGLPYSAVTLGVPTEILAGERRVALSPENVATLTKKGFKVNVQAGAGVLSAFNDAAYAAAGATIVPDAAAVYAGADIIFKVRQPQALPGGGHEVRRADRACVCARVPLLPPPVCVASLL